MRAPDVGRVEKTRIPRNRKEHVTRRKHVARCMFHLHPRFNVNTSILAASHNNFMVTTSIQRALAPPSAGR